MLDSKALKHAERAQWQSRKRGEGRNKALACAIETYLREAGIWDEWEMGGAPLTPESAAQYRRDVLASFENVTPSLRA